MRFKRLKGSVRAWYATNSLQLVIWVHGFKPSVIGKRWREKSVRFKAFMSVGQDMLVETSPDGQP